MDSSHNDNTHHRYPIVYNRNTDGGVEGYRENREYMDDELITSDGMYRYMGKEVMEMKGKERIEASVSAIKARRDKEMKRLEDMFDVKYVSRHERQRNDDRHIDKTRVKLGGDVIHGDYGLVLNRRFKSPLIPGYSPGEKYVVEKKREKKNGKGEGHIERKEGVAIVFSPIDSSLVVQDRIGRDMVRNLRSRVMDINKYNKKNMFFTKDANQNSLDQKLNVSSNQRFDKLKTMLTNPPLLRDIVTSTITSLKSKPEFKDLNLDPSSFDYHNISRSLERKPNRRFDIPKDRNLELYHLSYKFVRPNTIFDKSNINNGQKKNQIQENRRGKKTFDDTLNVNTLPYLYISPSI